MVRPLYAPHLLGVYAAHVVKKAVRRTPVFAVHRILTPDEAEGILERGEADAVTLVRALIADPDWPAKARARTRRRDPRVHRLQPGLLRQPHPGLPITCVTNPAVGREDELGRGTLDAGRDRKRVVVVGGGPAGLEAAWVAAARGHDVTLLERERRARRQDPPRRSGCPGAASSPTSPTGARASARAAASTSGWASRRPRRRCSRSSPTRWSSRPAGGRRRRRRVEVASDADAGRDQAWVIDHEQALARRATRSAHAS